VEVRDEENKGLRTKLSKSREQVRYLETKIRVENFNQPIPKRKKKKSSSTKSSIKSTMSSLSVTRGENGLVGIGGELNNHKLMLIFLQEVIERNEKNETDEDDDGWMRLFGEIVEGLVSTISHISTISHPLFTPLSRLYHQKLIIFISYLIWFLI